MKKTYGPLKITFPDRADWNLSRILAVQARKHGDKPFLTEPERDPAQCVYSYRRTDELASRIAGGLAARGFVKGDRLTIYLDNCAEYILAWFGASRAGVVEVPTNNSYFGDFLSHCTNVTSPRGIVVSPNYVPRFAEIGKTLAGASIKPMFFVVGGSVHAEIRSLRALGFTAESFDVLLNAAPLATPPEQQRQELGAILFTSGTTGPSKGVMMSHAQLYYFSEQCVDLTRLTEKDVFMTGNPLFHGNAQFLTTYPVLIAGASMFLYPKFSPAKFSERIAESQATVTNFVGVMMDWVAKQPPSDTDSKSRLRCVFSTPTAWSHVDMLKQRFGIEAFVECFGQTEICLPMLTPYGMARPAGSCGLAVTDWFDIRLADPETDEEVAQGEVGELQVRTKEPWLINSGYYGMPEATANARRNLWFHTGDGLREDKDGWYYFVDRLKDCLRRRGENISSFEVERPILAHEAVHDCAATGMPADEEAGEDEVGVFVILKEGKTATAGEIDAWVSTRLPEFLRPRYIRFVDSFPMTPSGKIQKVKLRAMGAGGMWDRLAAGRSR
ncbi:MAG: ATP-dependent acyl-CoA ligase [Alphaproteobacteria bacterium]|nr:ATP-dependent acyl-CoA ligase [Alphaproteobacteria bacterium]